MQRLYLALYAPSSFPPSYNDMRAIMAGGAIQRPRAQLAL